MWPLRRGIPVILATAATVARWSPGAAQSASTSGPAVATRTAPQACSLLTDAEVQRLIVRGQPSSGPVDTTALARGSVCYYPVGAQIILFSGPTSQKDFDELLKTYQRDKETRHPVSGVGDRAYIMFPTARDEYESKVAFLVTSVGQHTLGVSLPARKGRAQSVMAQYCRSGEVSKRDQKECEEVLADKGETAESLQPAVVEVAKAAVAKLR